MHTALTDADIARYNRVAERVQGGELTMVEAHAELGLAPPPATTNEETFPPFLTRRRSLATSAEIAREILSSELKLDEQSVASLTDDEAVRYAAQALTPEKTDPAEIEANLRAANALTEFVDGRPGTLTTIPEDPED